MKVQELKDELDKRGVEYTSDDKKADLEKKLEQSDESSTKVVGKSYGVTPDDFPEVTNE